MNVFGLFNSVISQNQMSYLRINQYDPVGTWPYFYYITIEVAKA